MPSYRWKIMVRWSGDDKPMLCEAVYGTDDPETVRKSQCEKFSSSSGVPEVTVKLLGEAPAAQDICPVCHRHSIERVPKNPKVCSVCEAKVCAECIRAPMPKRAHDELDDGLNDGICGMCVDEELLEDEPDLM